MAAAKTILVADDSQVSRELLSNILKTAGYDVIQAIDGGSALRVVKEHNIALAIIDHFMSPHGGFDFARELMNQKISLPMIMVTNEETSDLLVETTRHHIGSYLRKPVDPTRFLEVVRRSLREPAEKTPNIPSETFKLHYSQQELISKAIELAKKNAISGHGGPFGAIVADKDGKILGEGINGIMSRSDPAAHAEVMAIRQATEKLNKPSLEGCVLYCSSEPTRISKALIDSAGISKVFFGLSHADIREFYPSQSYAPVAYEQIHRGAAMEMMKEVSASGATIRKLS